MNTKLTRAPAKQAALLVLLSILGTQLSTVLGQGKDHTLMPSPSAARLRTVAGPGDGSSISNGAIARGPIAAAQSGAAAVAAVLPANYLVVLDGEPAASAFVRVHAAEGKAAALSAGRVRAGEIGLQHAAFSAQLRSLGVAELRR